MSNLIEMNNLTKIYNRIAVVDDVSLTANKGEIFGVIGEDGAGKTTLFRMMTTLLLADAGNGMIKGMDIVRDFAKIRKIIGYMPGSFSLYLDLSVEENINFFATIYGTSLKENYSLIKDIYTQIEPFKTRKAKALSGGMKQKLALCCSLVHRPEILFLDEPTTGVDPVSRKEFWSILKQLKTSGMTIIVSTPYMDEANLVDRIALMHSSKFLYVNTPAEMIKQFSKRLYAVYGSDMGDLLKDIRKFTGVETCSAFGDSCHLVVDKNLKVTALTSYLKTKGYHDIAIKKITPNIEDCFMEFIR